MESGDTKFDASQYAFFGNNVLEEVELGGLDDDDAGDAGFVGPGDEEYTPIYGRDMLEEGQPLIGQALLLQDEGVGSFTGVDDLAGAFSKLTRTVNEPKQSGIVSRGGSLPGQTSTADWAQEAESSYWPTQPALGAEQRLDNKNWWSQPPHPAQFADSRLQRTSSSPQQDAQYNPIEPILGPRPSPLQRMSSYPHQEPQYNNIELIRGNGSRFTPALMQHPNGFIPPQMPPPHQQNGMLPIQHSPPQFSQLHAQMLGAQHSPPQNLQMFGPRHPSPQMMGRFDPNFVMPDLSDPRARSMLHHGRHGPRYPPQGFEPGNMRMDNRWQRFRSKYMSTEEIENIARMQKAATQITDPYIDDYYHQACLARKISRSTTKALLLSNLDQRYIFSCTHFRSKYMSTEEIENIARMQKAATQITDPYIDDYYHQACLARKSAGAQLKHYFCPTLIRDTSSRARSKDEPHAYLQVDALGRLPFSSIRRPRPLLDVEEASEPSDSTTEKSASKSLDQEPMLAARITIEDGLCLLLDVDDIDRLLHFSKQPDGGLQLRNRRQALLEQLAESLQLVDPLTSNKDAPLSQNDDLVFLRIVSLPKGRKLLSRYIDLVTSGSELARIVCMAVFRNLRFIFGNLPSDSSIAGTTTKLVSAVSTCVVRMDLSGLSACLAAVACSSQQPPLRPLGYAAGDGASVIIKSLLDRATELLTDQHVASAYSMQNRTLWQASFDAFFGLLMGYCMSKFDTVVHTVQMQPAAAAVISRETPVELLRASLPHTNEYQRKQLLSFAQRTVPVNSSSSHGSGNVPMASEYVQS
uniref:mRNA decay factor PAT1 domain-containing protein n=1 Tax=Aegilops tauschii TaxID=37682 RepID=M8CJK5_AEGTA